MFGKVLHLLEIQRGKSEAIDESLFSDCTESISFETISKRSINQLKVT